MKKKFVNPKLTAYGDIRKVTQAIGGAPISDGVFVNNEQVTGIPTDGSGTLNL